MPHRALWVATPQECLPHGLGTWVKPGRFGSFFRTLFPSTWRTLSPDALFTRIWDTRKHPESATFSCLPCLYPGAMSSEMPIFMPQCIGILPILHKSRKIKTPPQTQKLRNSNSETQKLQLRNSENPSFWVSEAEFPSFRGRVSESDNFGQFWRWHKKSKTLRLQWSDAFWEVSCRIFSDKPPDPRRVTEGFQKGSLKGFRNLEGVSWRTLQNAFKNPSKPLQEGVEIDDAFGFPGL